MGTLAPDAHLVGAHGDPLREEHERKRADRELELVDQEQPVHDQKSGGGTKSVRKGIAPGEIAPAFSASTSQRERSGVFGLDVATGALWPGFDTESIERHPDRRGSKDGCLRTPLDDRSPSARMSQRLAHTRCKATRIKSMSLIPTKGTMTPPSP